MTRRVDKLINQDKAVRQYWPKRVLDNKGWYGMFFAREVWYLGALALCHSRVLRWRLTLEISAIHQTFWVKSIPYQPLLTKTYLQLPRQRRKKRLFSKLVFQYYPKLTSLCSKFVSIIQRPVLLLIRHNRNFEQTRLYWQSHTKIVSITKPSTLLLSPEKSYCTTLPT